MTMSLLQIVSSVAHAKFTCSGQNGVERTEQAHGLSEHMSVLAVHLFYKTKSLAEQQTLNISLHVASPASVSNRCLLNSRFQHRVAFICEFQDRCHSHTLP